MLFRINKQGTIILHKDSIKLCPRLKKLDQEQLLFTILAYDYGSPYKQFPVEERVRKAKMHVYQTSDYKHKKEGLINDCIEDYMSLQYDIRRQTLESYREKIIQLNNSLLAEKNARKISEIDEAITKLTKRCDQIQREIDQDEELTTEIKGGGKISFIERWQKNQREYKQQQKLQTERYFIANPE